MSLKGIAQENLAIFEQGWYSPASGARVELRSLVDRAVTGTTLYRPAELDLMIGRWESRDVDRQVVEVTAETTAQAARRLVERDGREWVAALSFASAKNPGGGFLGGAKAQEEDLARCSALYPCLVAKREYYDANRACTSLLYTDHIIYSPDVPFLRDDNLELLERPFLASIITAPAPNAGEALRRDPAAGPHIHATLQTRAAKVLAVAAANDHSTLVLGAWGCGVFRNEARVVADVFAALLAQPRFVGAFQHVTFAVHDRSSAQGTIAAFRERFGAVE